MDWKDVVRALLEAISAKRQAAEIALREATAAIAEAPGPMQSHSDTTRYQKSHIAEDAARSIAEKDRALIALNILLEERPGMAAVRASLASIVTIVDEAGSKEIFALLPFGAGIQLVVGDDSVTAISLESPLGEALLGKAVGDEFLAIDGMRWLRLLELR